jgi:hypothetical protein
MGMKAPYVSLIHRLRLTMAAPLTVALLGCLSLGLSAQTAAPPATPQVPASTGGVDTRKAIKVPPSTEKILFKGDFESGDLTGWSSEEFPTSSKGEVVTEHPRAGKYCLKQVLKFQDFPAKKRCEVSKYDIGIMGTERWYGFSIYLPGESFPDETFDIVAQIHGNPDRSLNEPWRSPVLSVETHGHDWMVVNRSDKEPLSKPAKDGAGGTIQTQILWTGPYVTDEWTDWVLHVKWSIGDDGLVEVWKNGQKIATRQGPNCYNDVERQMFFKIGIYKPGYRPTCKPERVVYDDEIRIGSELASYDDVAPPKK